MQEIENELRSLADRRAELDAEAAELRSRAVEHVAAVVKQLGITSRWSIDDPALGALDAPERIDAGAMFQYMPAGDGRRKAIGMQRTVSREALQ